MELVQVLALLFLVAGLLAAQLWVIYELAKIGRLRGFHFDDDWEVVPGEPDPESWLTRTTGVVWIGLFVHIHTYLFSWTEERRNNQGVPEAWHRPNVPTQIFYLAPFPYLMILKDAEDKEGFQLDLVFVVTIRINNPYRALFGNADWLGELTGQILGVGRNWVGKTTYQAILAEKESSAGPQVVVEILDLNNAAPQHLGVTIEGCSLTQVALLDGALNRAVNARRVAELEGAAALARATAEGAANVARAEAEKRAAKIRAEGVSEATRTEALGQAEAIKTLNTAILDSGDRGLVLEQLRAMDKFGKSGGQLVWAPGIDTALAQLFRLGLKPGDVAEAIQQEGDPTP